MLLLSPYAPHLAEELWSRLGHQQSLAYEPWPECDEALLVVDTINLPVQVRVWCGSWLDCSCAYVRHRMVCCNRTAHAITSLVSSVHHCACLGCQTVEALNGTAGHVS